MSRCIRSLRNGTERNVHMELTLTRAGYQQPGTTIGELRIDGLVYCYTLEDQVREPNTPRFKLTLDEWVWTWKIKGTTAIPRGTYEVTIDFSSRFQCLMPHILDVPGFEGVRIHSGNSAADTEGCILVGQRTEGNLVLDSRAAFKPLLAQLKEAFGRGEKIYLTIS